MGAKRTAVWIAVAIPAASLFGGFLVKDRCARDLEPGGPGWRGQQYSSNCYSDIIALYSLRGFQKDNVIAYRDANIEYPALTGLFISLVNIPVRPDCAAGGLCGSRGFFVANVIGLLPFGFLTAGFLASVLTRRWRILYYALAPAILAYGFHNWDLIPVALTAGAMWAFTKRRDGLAGILLGLGTASKLYPAVVVPVLLVALFRRKNRSGMMLLFLGASAGFLIPNLWVFALAGFDGWWHPWQFQGKRFPNPETSWYLIYRHLGASGGEFWAKTYPVIVQWASTAIFLLSGVVLLWRELRREVFRPFVTATGMVLIFLITSKVFSPQFALWLLPFLVIAGLPWWSYGLFVVADLFVLATIWWYLTAYGYPDQVAASIGAPGVECASYPPCAAETNKRLNFLEIAVWFRYVVLLLLLWLSRRAPEHADHSEAPLSPAAEPAAG